MKKLGTLLMALCLLAALVGCSSETEKGPDYNVGVIQYVQHEALDKATNGFVEALTKAVEADGKTVNIEVKNASNESANCTTIAADFLSNNVDLIMANATPALLAATTATDSTPILGTSITVYDAAFDGTTPANVSGTSDLAPLDKQAEMFNELLPEANTIGLLYCSAEKNSAYQIETIESYLTQMGKTCKRYSFAEASELSMVVEQACQEVDAIYIPTDNTCAANTETIANVVLPNNIPVIAGENGICTGCGIATLSIDYYDIGYATGLMAYEILVNGKSVSDMPVEFAPEFTYLYNPDNCAYFNIDVPSNYQPIE